MTGEMKLEVEWGTGWKQTPVKENTGESKHRGNETPVKRKAGETKPAKGDPVKENTGEKDLYPFAQAQHTPPPPARHTPQAQHTPQTHINTTSTTHTEPSPAEFCLVTVKLEDSIDHISACVLSRLWERAKLKKRKRRVTKKLAVKTAKANNNWKVSS